MTVREQLQEALASEAVVRIERTPRFAEPIHGFVVLVGSKWVLMRQISDGGYFDGLVAFRLKQVSRITTDTTIAPTFAKTRPEWPPAAPADIEISSTPQLLRSLAAQHRLIGIQQERKRSALWIGVLDEVSEVRAYLREVRPYGTWKPEPLGYRLRAITSVEVGTRYLDALGVVSASRAESPREDGAR